MSGLEMKYFVLKPKGHNPYAEASRVAMKSYANSIRNENLALCTDIHVWVIKEERTVNKIIMDEERT